MPIVYRFDPPTRFVTGTVGEPGSRTFFVQARNANSLISVALEKQQAQLLANEIEELLDKLLELGESAEEVPQAASALFTDTDPLESPIEEQFRAGTITLAWEPTDQRVVLELFALPADNDAPDAEPDEMLLVRLPSAMARAFVARTRAVADAGREPCPFCGGPIDPGGHLCPRANGFKRRQ